ncbi:universal stress protein [Domibacillus sp. DTU_2020_1001157_1_SI_ALB_TIR_016]|uniref:universal stress protein n=1 Tax=Domibacillus sp. DTU_2020_1001157_1_SI_ALB_TIR_016 TaxID=3077789 RepID=UPI0028E73BC5|nr:universal stress protein [Domibacillus sp. DTU_2020_1001157_1_SI_ALB_TIR_016]WNS80979.1 universal stress protein [Domibacillus sp. DTU_2020_1001157_1_SI_ALB_TIR_016]
MNGHILLASDGSSHALRAAEEAIKLAKVLNKEIVIVFVVDFDQSKRDVLHSAGAIDLEQKRRKQLQSTEQKIREAGVSYSIQLLHGVPGPAIVEYANKEAVSYVVLGSRGLNSLQEMVLGSVSHKVAKRVNCPVLIVK